MDVSSLNSGTVETKGWLNPVCGELEAKNVVSETLQKINVGTGQRFPISGAIYERALANSAAYTVGDTLVEITSTNVLGSNIPADELVEGSTYEFYVSGRFGDITPTTGGAIKLFPSFSLSAPATSTDYFAEITVDALADAGGSQRFESRCIFRVLTKTDTTVTLEVSWSSMCDRNMAPSYLRNFVAGLQTINTPSRLTNVAIPFVIWARGDVGPYILTRTQYYLRRVY